MSKSILITGGHVIDPKRGIDEIGDVLIEEDRIVENQSIKLTKDTYTINAKGCLVLPGLIDFHSHVFFGGSANSVPSDICMLPNCVTTTVDAGTAGTGSYEIFHRSVIANSIVRIKSLLSISPMGQVSNISENQDPKYIDVEGIKLLFRKYPDELRGLKIRISKEIVGDLGLEPIKKALEIAEQIECPIVVHTTNPCCDTRELIQLFRAGDVFAHAYHGMGSTIIGSDKHVLPEVKEARKRGVIFDAANGRSHFAFKTAEAALLDNFLPDVISSDLSETTMFKEPVFGLPWLMSKYLTLGMNFNDIIAACTSTPARLMGMEDEIGTLSPGACADVAILKPIDHKCKFYDSFNDSRYGEKLLLPHMTIRAGRIVFRQLNFQ